MNKKILAIVLSVGIIITSGLSFEVVYLTYLRYRFVDSINWSFPHNCTFHPMYITVPYMVSMRDSVKLATDVYIPRDIEESLPIILIRTPYNKDGVKSIASSYVKQDYIVVVQDTRGFYQSDGEKELPFGTDQVDGQDTLKWLELQPWSNDKIGTIGSSALGITQYLMAPGASSSLKCQVPIVGTADLYNAIYQGGQLRYELIVPWMQANKYSEEIIHTVIQNEKLSPIWDPVRIIENYSQINAASLHFGGWYDIFAQDTINAFVGYQYQGGPSAKGNAKLIMGPWLHGNFYGGATGEIEFPNQDTAIAAKAQDAVLSKWLKDDSIVWDQYPTVLYYLMSSVDYNPDKLGNHWYQSEIWPILTNCTDLYLVGEQEGDFYGLLGEPNDAVFNPLEWIWDPSSPIVTIGGNNLVLPAGMYDQSSIEQRSDVIVFNTPELSNAVTVVGAMNVTLWISSNCTDTDITVKITDVYPDGKSMLITDSILRLRNRNGLSNWDFMIPGTIYEITIPLTSTAYVFNEGHKIRLIVSSSNNPRFETNPNTGEPIWGNSTYYIAQNAVYCNTTYPSHISLPIVDYTTLSPFIFDLG